MTDPFGLVVASVAAGLGTMLGWMFWPRSPDLDGERWFKLQLSTLLLGYLDAEGAETEDWMKAVLAQVPYHPAGHEPERKVAGLAPGTTAIEGERALCEKLAALPDASARWAFMYDEDEIGLGARLDDPVELGSAYDPSSGLGPHGSWKALEDWGGGRSRAFLDAVERSLNAVWVLVDGPETAAPVVLDAIEGLVQRSVRVHWDGLEGGLALGPALRDPATRVVLVGQGEGIAVALRNLRADAAFRDRVLAVVSLGGTLGRSEDQDWMEANFTHHKLDTEVTRLTPYMALQWLDREASPPGAFGLPLAAARFPEAKLEALTQVCVQSVDLGVLPLDSDPVLVAHGVVAFVGSWVAAHRSG